MKRMSSRLKATICLLVAISMLAGPLIMPQPAEAGFNPIRAIGGVIKGVGRVLRTVDRGVNKLTNGVYRVVRPIVPKPFRPAAREFIGIKARTLTHTLTGLDKVGKEFQKIAKHYKKLERVRQLNRKVAHVRGKARKFANKISEVGTRGQHSADRLIVRATMEGLITPKEARRLWREATEANIFTQKLSKRVHGMADRITTKNVLKEGFGQVKRILQGSGRREKQGSRGGRGILQKVLKEGKELTIGAVVTGLREGFEAEVKTRIPDYILKKGVAHAWGRVSAKTRKTLQEDYNVATGAVAVLKNPEFTLSETKKIINRDLQGLAKSRGRPLPIPDPKLGETGKAIAKGTVRRAKEDFPENLRKKVIERLKEKFPGAGQDIEDLHRRWKQNPQERDEIWAELRARLDALDKAKKKDTGIKPRDDKGKTKKLSEPAITPQTHSGEEAKRGPEEGEGGVTSVGGDELYGGPVTQEGERSDTSVGPDELYQPSGQDIAERYAEGEARRGQTVAERSARDIYGGHGSRRSGTDQDKLERQLDRTRAGVTRKREKPKRTPLPKGKRRSASKPPSSGQGLTDITVNSKKITVTFWDHGQEDGDIIDIILNGKVLRGGIVLTKAPQSITVDLKGRKNRFGVRAVNEGSVPPNTATVQFSDVTKGDAAQVYEIKSNQRTDMNITVSKTR
jgi:hypothetical protein